MRIDKSELAEMINQLKHIIQKSVVTEDVDGILVENNYFIARNSEVTAMIKLNIDTAETFIIPPKAIDFISALPDEEITIEQKDNIITLKTSKMLNKFNTFNTDMFMYQKEKEDKSMAFSIEADELKRAISDVLYAIPSNASNKLMSALYIESTEEGTDFVGLDRTRIAISRIAVKGNCKIIIPKSSIEKIMSMDLAGDVDVYINKNFVIFETDRHRICSIVLNGEYFKYKRILERKGGVKLCINKKDIVSALNRTKMCEVSSEKSPLVLNIDNEGITMTYKNSFVDYSEKVQNNIDNNTNLRIGFSVKLLSEALKSFTSNTIYMIFSTNKEPVFLSDDTMDYTAVVLPVSLRQ